MAAKAAIHASFSNLSLSLSIDGARRLPSRFGLTCVDAAFAAMTRKWLDFAERST